MTQEIHIRPSSLIKKLRYSNSHSVLEVTFKEGDKEAETYRYFGVGPSTMGYLLTADSLGSAFTKLVRKQHKFVKIS